MRSYLLSMSLLLSFTAVLAQNWKPASPEQAIPRPEYTHQTNHAIYQLDRASFDRQLRFVEPRNTGKQGTPLLLPNAQGAIEQFLVWEASNFHPSTQTKYPQIRSYVGKSISDPSAYLRLSTYPKGISSTIFRAHKPSEFLETYSTDGRFFEVHTEKGVRENFICSTPEDHTHHYAVEDFTNKSSDQKFRTYRFALSVTGEYSQYFGGTIADALAAMNATMTRVNGVFEKDLAINFVLADNIESLIFLDAETDPYSDISGMGNWNLELQNHLTDHFGNENYDLGHLFGHSGGGGNAGCIGCVCVDPVNANHRAKGSAFTSPYNNRPHGDLFDIDYVAHEIGHQVGANHTFSFRTEGTGVNVEPGGGSTIMAYAGITQYNVQNNSDDYFAYRSIHQIQTNLANKTLCGVEVPILNAPPEITLSQANYAIPKGTAFKLDAQITDPDGDQVITTWEQNNTGTATTQYGNSRVSATKVIGPNFRSFSPVDETYRYFPTFDRILKNTLTHTGANNSVWESVTTVARVFDFSVTARDHNIAGPQTETKLVRVRVLNNGPFIITTPNTTDHQVNILKDSLLISWNVAGTDIAPINTEFVKASISWDNGVTFSELGEVPNHGEAQFPLPDNAIVTDKGFIMLEAVDNVFLAVKNFKSNDEILGINDFDRRKSFLLHPNPSPGKFTITKDLSPGMVTVQLTDLTGRIVYKQAHRHSGGEFSKTITVHIPKGTYIVSLVSSHDKLTSKLIIQ